MLIGIDLLWVRPGINGGTESAIRNLMNGFGSYDDKNEYILFAGKDTAESFSDYEKYPNMRIEVCDTECLKRIKRIAWENTKLDKLARKLGVELMFIPVYSKPNSLNEKKGGIPYITVIHDLQALHFPEYFSKNIDYPISKYCKFTKNISDQITKLNMKENSDVIFVIIPHSTTFY